MSLLIRRGWDWQGNECWLVLEETPSSRAPSWTKVYRARIDYGPIGTKIDLGEVVASGLKMIKSVASDRARRHGFVPRSDWAPFEETTMNPMQNPSCPQCGGTGAYLGNLGVWQYFRCIQCGWEFSPTSKAKRKVTRRRRGFDERSHYLTECNPWNKYALPRHDERLMEVVRRKFRLCNAHQDGLGWDSCSEAMDSPAGGCEVEKARKYALQMQKNPRPSRKARSQAKKEEDGEYCDACGAGPYPIGDLARSQVDASMLLCDQCNDKEKLSLGQKVYNPCECNPRPSRKARSQAKERMRGIVRLHQIAATSTSETDFWSKAEWEGYSQKAITLFLQMKKMT